MAGASEPATDKQVSYAFALLKQTGAHTTHMADLDETIPHTEYDRQRDTGRSRLTTWNWLVGLSKSEISEVIEHLQGLS